MPVYKDEKTNTWKVLYRTKDWTGALKQHQKRGFKTKKEAQEYEREMLSIANADLDMTFEKFVEVYEKDIRVRLKETSWSTKEYLIHTKILPYFKNLKMNEIKPRHIILWQNEMLNERNEKGEKHSPVYLKTLHNQVSAIFNHAVRFYELKTNPAAKAGSMGKSKGKERDFWTQDEYKKFSFAIMDKPVAYYAFEVLYWCGVREGELLALTMDDFDLKKGTVSINKNYHRIDGRDVITDPKTRKSNRVITMPDFLVTEMKEYFSTLRDIKSTDRVFNISTHFLHREMRRGSAAAGVKKICIHGIRHSHISMLISMGYSAVAIADRVGHESIAITLQYAHMFPSAQQDMADDLNRLKGTDI